VFVDFNILNQLGSPSINSNTFANRPAAGQTGRLFVSTDTFEIYRDNGTTWDLIGSGSAGISGSGTATQVAYFTGATAIGSSANLYWDNTNTRLGIGTSSPGVRLDVHGTGNMLQLNATGATANTLMSFQRLGSNVWRLGEQYAGGFSYFEIHNGVINNNAVQFEQANNKATFSALETYSSGGATGSLFSYTITVPNGTNFTGPNVIGNVNSALILDLGGNTTVPNSARQGLEGNSRINFTGAGTLTMTQGTGTVRAFSALSSVYSFSGSAVGTITHLAGYRACFPDNIGSAVNITNNYAILINDQTTGTGTVTYTNRWGIYQEGASDLNYFNGNLLIKSTTNTGQALQVTGTAIVSSSMTSASFIPTGAGVPVNGLFLPAANSIGLATNTTERVRINASGQIGLATATIGSTLQVNGNAAIGYSVSTVAPTNGLIVAGQVGVGVSPAVGFIIDASASGDQSIRVSTTSTGVNANAAIRLNATTEGSWLLQTGNSGAGALRFYDSNAGADRMRIFSNGNIGINTNTAGSKLQVNGNCAIGYSASTAAPTNGLVVAGNTSIGKSTNAGNILEVTGASQIRHQYTGAATDLAIGQFNASGDASINNTANGLLHFATNGATRLTIPAAGGLTFADANNIAFNTTTGTKIGTATSQKLAFWNATPIVQPTTAVAGAARVGGGGATVTDTDTFGGYTIAQVVQALRNTGILA
jgi:hypothetical protein